MTEASWLGTVISFQVTFTKLFIAATVLIAGAYHFGWRSLLLGGLFGTSAVAVLAWGLEAFASRYALQALDGLSAALLLTFGGYLLWEFFEGLGSWELDGTLPLRRDSGWYRPVNLTGVNIGACALITTGLKILIVWFGVALREGAKPATLGVLVGATLISALAVSLGRTGIFRCVPGFLWDGSAACLVMAYGSNFLALALVVS